MEETAEAQARKRPIEDTTSGGVPKRQALHGEFGSSEDTLTLRILLPSQVVGCLIGKGGATAKQIREESGVRMQISESQPDVPERMLSLTGTLPVLSSAYGLVTKRLSEEGARFGQQETVSFKVVVPTPQIGALIGKAGATVKEMREQSHTTIQVSPPSDFPERIVTVNGEPQAVSHALYLISQKLVQNPLRGGAGGPGGGYGGGAGGPGGGYGGGYGGGRPPHGGYSGGYGGGYGGPPPGGYGGGFGGNQGGYGGPRGPSGPPPGPRPGPGPYGGRAPPNAAPPPGYHQAPYQHQPAQPAMPQQPMMAQPAYTQPTSGYGAAPVYGGVQPAAPYSQPAAPAMAPVQQPLLSQPVQQPIAQQPQQHQSWDGAYSGYGQQQQSGGSQQQVSPASGIGGNAAAAASGQTVQQVTLTNDMVGHLIGKGGARINQIRQLSGAQIKIADMQPGAVARLVTLSGTAEQVQAAQYYVNSALEGSSTL